MKTVTFEASMASDGQIKVPKTVADQLEPGAELRVILQWGRAQEGDEWRQASLSWLEGSYSPEDKVYEQLID